MYSSTVQVLRLCTGRTVHRGSRGIALLFLDHGTRRGEVLASRPGRSLPRERPGTHCTGGWVGTRVGLDRCGKSRPPPGFVPRTVQPVASRYTDWASRPMSSHIGHEYSLTAMQKPELDSSCSNHVPASSIERTACRSHAVRQLSLCGPLTGLIPVIYVAAHCRRNLWFKMSIVTCWRARECLLSLYANVK